MNHLSFYWLPDNKQLLIEAVESEFAELVELSLRTGRIILPPIPDVVIRIQKMTTEESTTISDIANCLADDPSLAAVVIRIANSVIFNRRNITCNDLITAVSRLGIMRVRDIVTAQSIEQIKHSINLSHCCNKMLAQSASVSRELGATMVLVVQAFRELEPEKYKHLEQEKALLVGLLADIGLFCLVNEYHMYLEKGNYLDQDIALQVFQSRCSETSNLVLKQWGFDEDFLEVCRNKPSTHGSFEVSYLDVARIANHLLMFRKQDDDIDDHEVEINADGAEVLFQLSNLSESEFNSRLRAVINASGF